MSFFKCKMCGGTIEFNTGDTIGTCDSCGTKQTLPRIDGTKRANLYDRANHFRRANEYDKAANLFNQILNEDPEDAEGYWSLVLCKYGIEYVEDPTSKKRIPTVNRAQFISIFQDENYKAALKYADDFQKEIYEEEAKTIDDIQKRILDISKKEAPFDVFISYKESDVNGRRTKDSVLATDLYENLTKEGFKVFLSRITLEDKLGTAYEPYIFAALNSSKVMVAIGTSRENYDAVWVKNEWSRYLALIANGEGKTLIPAYRDMDPYDLPEEFSHLQAQDMSKLGFMQDLVRGIKKIIGEKTNTQAEMPQTVNPTNAVEPLITRAKMFIEDGEWKKAEDICERALNIDPERADIYICLLLIDFKVSSLESFVENRIVVEDNSNYVKARKFGSREQLKELDDLGIRISYEIACNFFRTGKGSKDFEKAKKLFESLNGYEDSEDLVIKCSEKIDFYTKKEKKDKTNKLVIAGIICVIAIISFVVFYNTVLKESISKKNQYKEAVELMANEDYENAIKAFGELGEYQDSVDKIEECNSLIFEAEINKIRDSYEKGNYHGVFELFGRYKKRYLDGAAKSDEKEKRRIILFNECYKYAVLFLEKDNPEISPTFIENIINNLLVKLHNSANQDEHEKVLDYEYEYVKKYPRTELDSYLGLNRYWKDLLSMNYKDIRRLNEELLKWEVEVYAINADGDDEVTNNSRFKKSETVYFHYRVTNATFIDGIADPKTKIKVKGVFPSGSETRGMSDYYIYFGSEGWWNFYYDNPKNSPAGELKVTFYDENDNVMGEASVELI